MRGEHERDRVGAGEVEAVVALLDAQRRRLGLTLDAARDDGDGAVLAEAARGRQDDAVDHGPADRRQRDPPERLPRRRAERARGLLLLVADLAQRRHDLARDERQRDEDRREHHRRQREEHLDVVLARASRRTSRRGRRAGTARGRRRPARARAAGRRTRSGAPCPGSVAGRSPARTTMPNTVFSGTAIAVISSVSLNAFSVSGRRDRSPRGLGAVLERPPEDHRERADEDRGKVEERDPAERRPSRARLPTASRCACSAPARLVARGEPPDRRRSTRITTNDDDEQHDRDGGGAGRGRRSRRG